MAANDLSSLAEWARARRSTAPLRLYETFRGYRLSEYGSAEGACPHCITKDQFAEIVPARIEEGLPLAQSMWSELASYRARVFSEHIERCREAPSSSAIAVLARALTGVVEGKQKRELKARLLSVIPSDDLLLSWMRTEEPEQLMAAALARGIDDDNALCVGTALSNLALLALAWKTEASTEAQAELESVGCRTEP